MKKLHDQIRDCFSLNDLRTLCFDFNLHYENFRGETLDERILSILAFFQKRDKLPILQTYLTKHRENFDWPPLFENVPNYQASARVLDVPVQLPFQRPEHFVGREAEMAQLLDALHLGQKVTVWAAGGMGKSALTAEAVFGLHDSGDLLNRFPDGVIFYSFYGRGQSESLYEHIIRTYTPENTEFTFDNAYRALAGKQMLLIFDGAEEAENLRQAVRLQGQSGLLITTRDRQAHGGTRIELDVLPLPEAKRLLSSWSQAEMADGVAEAICEQIGRLPLAVRIAGFYLDQTGEPPADYLEMLTQTPIRELSQGDSQYESVGILLERTVAQLPTSAQTALAVLGNLALLPTPLDPLAALLKPGKVREAVNNLFRFGLLQRQETTIQLAHALIHTYARRRLPLDNEHLAQLASYFVQLAHSERVKGVIGYKHIYIIRPHIFAILKSCMNQEMWHEANQIVWSMLNYLYVQGFQSMWEPLLITGIESTRMLDNKHDEGSHLGTLAMIYDEKGKTEKAIFYYEKSLDNFQEIGDWKKVGFLLDKLGIANHNLDKIEKAINYYERAIKISHEIMHTNNKGSQIRRLGLAYHDLGNFEKAVKYYEQALAISRAEGDRYIVEASFGSLGIVHSDLGETQKAISFFLKALTRAQRENNEKTEAKWLYYLASSHHTLQKFEKAISYGKQALQIYQTEEEKGRILGNLGISFWKSGQREEAIKYFAKALKLSRKTENNDYEVRLLFLLGVTFFELRQFRRSVIFLNQALAISCENGHREIEGYCLANLGLNFFELRELEKAKEYLLSSLPILKQFKDSDVNRIKNLIKELQT